jgi:hypothetical protein
MLAETPVASISPTYESDKSATRIDIALLVSALFLQRFALPFFAGKLLGLHLLPIALIFLYQFLSGKLLLQYDRLLWFLAVALAASCSLLLNFKSTMLTSYFEFILLYWFFTLTRPSTTDLYKSTVRVFQLLVLTVSLVGVAQFIAQFIVDGRRLIVFYGIVPDFLLSAAHDQASGEARTFGSGIIKSNGIFLAEPSALSQITALGILIEVLEFRRPRYLVVMTLGFLVAYSGTGLMTLLLFLPLAGLRNSRAGASVFMMVVFSLGLFVTGIIDLSAFTSRVDEFDTVNSSGFGRFVAPFWLAAKQFDTGSLQTLLAGSGPGTVTTFTDLRYSTAAPTWLKLLFEYGIIGSFIFVCFLASCLRKSRCPGLVLAALLFTYVFHGGAVLNPPLLTIIMVLCTLHGPELRRRSVDEASRYGPSLVAGSAGG